MTSGRGVDTAIEAVGVPATFVLREDIVASGGTIANVAQGPGGSASRTPVVAEHHDHDPARG
jgi:threonine dehydrogenase-like Zn-dependent dehydrogenase